MIQRRDTQGLAGSRFRGFRLRVCAGLSFPPPPREARARAERRWLTRRHVPGPRDGGRAAACALPERRWPTRRGRPQGCATSAVIASRALRDTFWGHPEMEGILRAQIAHGPRHTPTCQQSEQHARKTRCSGYFCEALPGVGPVGRQGGRRSGIPSEGIREAFLPLGGVRRRFSAPMRRKISA